MANWRRTIEALSRVKWKLDSNGYFEGRPIIGRDTQIDGGVSLGGSSREAIVVDFGKSPYIQNLYRLARQKSSREGVVQKELVLRAVYDVVMETMHIKDEYATEALLDNLGIMNDQKVSLDLFVEKGIGVCRHNALVTGVVLERFKKDNHISGNVSADRNSCEHGGHMWTRYSSKDGRTWILDVTQEYFGGLKQAIKEGRWPYQRPEDTFIPQ